MRCEKLFAYMHTIYNQLWVLIAALKQFDLSRNVLFRAWEITGRMLEA